MLADPRSKTLIDQLRRAVAAPAQSEELRTRISQAFPDFDDNLRQAMKEETTLFFDSIMREDRSVMDLLNADYTFVNERLARHYGIPNVYGSQFRRVKVAERRAPRTARSGQHSDRDVVSESHLAGRARQVDADESPRRAAAAAAAERPAAAGSAARTARCCRCASAWRRTARIRCARAVTR